MGSFIDKITGFVLAIEKLLEHISKPEYAKPVLFFLLFAAAIVFFLLSASSGFTGPISVSLDTAGRIVSGSMAVVFFSGAIYVLYLKTSPTPLPDPCCFQVYQESAGGDAINYFFDLIKDCDDSDVVMMGTGLAFLAAHAPLTDLISLVNTGHIRRLEILLADPNSHAVHVRLLEEEGGSNVPNIGLTGLEHHIRWIIDEINTNTRDKSHIDIRLFSNYPTFAMLRAGDHYLIYNYSFAKLGTMSPLLSLDGHCETLRDFFDAHYERVKESSVDARWYFQLKDAIQNRRITGDDIAADLQDLAGFSVYFVPEGDFYELGTSIIGYDVRARANRHTSYEDYVGSARPYGFHLTIVDALYASNRHAMSFLEHLVAHLFRKFGPIPVRYAVAGGFPDENSISLKCEDHTGKLYALHSELVSHVYTQAVGSNYTLFDAPENRVYCTSDEQRKSMTELYHAPYILKCFEPHLTLLSNVPQERIAQVAEEIRTRFHDQYQDPHFDISKLAVMRKVRDRWQMPEREVEL